MDTLTIDLSDFQPRFPECQLTVGAEIKLSHDQTMAEINLPQEKVTTSNNKLPQRNSGFEKKSLNNNRAKPQMLGNLTFREIAEKRKEMFKSDLIKHTENDGPRLTPTPVHESSFKSNKIDNEGKTFENDRKEMFKSDLVKHTENDGPHLTPTPVHESSFKSNKIDNEGKTFENDTAFINPHRLVGKTITLQQGDIRHIKFLSQNSTSSCPSNKKLLKLDSLQLSPKIIVQKCKPGSFPSMQTTVNYEDLKKINGCQMGEQVYMLLANKSEELNFQRRSLNHSKIHNHSSSSNKLEKEELSRNHSGPKEKASSEKDVCNCTENFGSVQGAKEEKVAKCECLSSSHDNLTILSQVACDELEINKQQFGSKEETKHLLRSNGKNMGCQHRTGKTNFECVSLDQSYKQKSNPMNECYRGKQFASAPPSKSQIFLEKIGKQIPPSSQQRNNRNFEWKPMFAWCTQYITQRRPLNTNDDSVTKIHKFPATKKKLLDVESKKVQISLNGGQVKTSSIQNTFKINNNDNSKRQSGCKGQDDTLKEEDKTKATNFFGLSNKTPLLKTQENKIVGTLSSKSQLCPVNEDINDSCSESTKTTVEPLFSSSKGEKKPEINDEVVVLKEILVTKSQSCNIFLNDSSSISKQNSYNIPLLGDIGSQRNTIESHKFSPQRKILIEIPAKEEQTFKKSQKRIYLKADEPCPETKMPSFKNDSSFLTTTNMNANQGLKNIGKNHNTPLKTVKGQGMSLMTKHEESHDHTLKSKSLCKSEKKIKAASLGKTCPIKKCYVLIERLVETIPVEKNSKINTELCNKNTDFKQNVSTSEKCMVHVKSNFNENQSGVQSTKYLQEKYPKTSLACHENNNISKSEPQCEESTCGSHSENNISSNTKTVCKRKKRHSYRNSKSCVASKKAKLPRGRPRKLITYHALNHTVNFEMERTIIAKEQNNVLLTNHENINNLKSEPHGNESIHVLYPENITLIKQDSILESNTKKGCKRKMGNSNEESESCTLIKKVKLPRGRPKKLVINHILNNTVQPQSKKPIPKIKNTPKTKLSGIKVDIDYQQENICSKYKDDCDIENRDEVSNRNDNDINLSPKRAFSGNREIYSLLADFTTLGCSIEPKRKLRSIGKSVIYNLNPMYSATTVRNQEDIQILKEFVDSNNPRPRKKISLDKTKNVENVNSLPTKMEKLQPRHSKQSLQGLNRSPMLNCKQNLLDPIDVALGDLTSNASSHKAVNKNSADYAMLANDSNISGNKLSVSNNSPVRLGFGKRQSKRVVKKLLKASLKPQAFHKEKCYVNTVQNEIEQCNYKSNRQTFLVRKFDQKVKKSPVILKDQLSHNNLSKSVSTTEHVQDQGTAEYNGFVNHSARFKKPTPHESCPPSNQQTNVECLGNKSSANIESSTSSDFDHGINRQFNKVTTKVDCNYHNSNQKQERGEAINNQITNQSTVRDKIRLLVIEQLKKSRRGHKVATRKLSPKR